MKLITKKKVMDPSNIVYLGYLKHFIHIFYYYFSSIFTYNKIIKMRCIRLMNMEFTNDFCFTVHYTLITFSDCCKFTENQ